MIVFDMAVTIQNKCHFFINDIDAYKCRAIITKELTECNTATLHYLGYVSLVLISTSVSAVSH